MKLKVFDDGTFIAPATTMAHADENFLTVRFHTEKKTENTFIINV